MESKKLVIIAALECEVSEIAKILDIKLAKESHYLCGENSDIAILVAGIGGLKMACAIGYASAKYSPQRYLNFGIAGCANKQIGNIYLIDKITKNKKSIYPDILIKSNFQNAFLESVDEPKLNNAIKDLLYDMEGYEFALSALNFVSVDKIYILKQISDNCDGTKIDANFVKNLVAAQINQIQDFIVQILNQKEQIEILDKNTLLELKNKAKADRLSFSRTNQLIELTKSEIRQSKYN